MDVSLSSDQGRVTALEPLYAEVCRAHDSITDFRGKLLALVPSLSAVAFTLFIGTGKHFDQRLLLPVGIFGVIVSLGLFFYELSGMLECHKLRRRGGELERAIQQSAGDEVMQGHFLNLPVKDGTKKDFKGLKKVFRDLKKDLKDLHEYYSLISVPTASFLVYGSVILGWLVVTAFGIAGFLSTASA
jgi:hypothetical protein